MSLQGVVLVADNARSPASPVSLRKNRLVRCRWSSTPSLQENKTKGLQERNGNSHKITLKRAISLSSFSDLQKPSSASLRIPRRTKSPNSSPAEVNTRKRADTSSRCDSLDFLRKPIRRSSRDSVTNARQESISSRTMKMKFDQIMNKNTSEITNQLMHGSPKKNVPPDASPRTDASARITGRNPVQRKNSGTATAA